ncbi:MAG: Ig-like domain-containing protein [Nannocystales bacterium]
MSVRRLRRMTAAVAMFVATALPALACSFDSTPAAQHAEDPSTVVLSNLSSAQRGSLISEPAKARLFLEGRDVGPGMQAVSASLHDAAVVLNFRYPLDPHASYELHHPALEGLLDIDGAPRVATPPTVEGVVPDADVLPSNVLRLYIEFNEPMSSKFRMSEAVELVDVETGLSVDASLLDIERPLFDRTNTRLTVIFNPGRTKRGVGSNLDGGAPLQPNRRYALRIKAGLLDEEGDTLREDFEHVFRTVEPNRSALDTAGWNVRAPGVGTRDPLVVEFDRWLDPYQAENRIVLANPHGRRFPIHAESSGKELRLQPTEAWQPGCYTMAVSAELEDVAGNRTIRAFDDQHMGTRTATRIRTPLGDATACD